MLAELTSPEYDRLNRGSELISVGLCLDMNVKLTVSISVFFSIYKIVDAKA